MKGIPRLLAILPEAHAAFARRLRRILEEDDRGELEAWLGVRPEHADRPVCAQVLGDGAVRRALRERVLQDCLREIFVAPNRLFDELVRDEAGGDAQVRRLLDDPSLPFYLRAPGELAGRASGAARRAAADVLSRSKDLEAFVAALREGDGEVVFAAI